MSTAVAAKPCNCEVLHLECSLSTDMPRALGARGAFNFFLVCPTCRREFTAALSHGESDGIYRAIRKFLKPKRVSFH